MSRYIARWTKGRRPAELAASAARATVIAVVPGVLWIWLAWCLVRELNKARLRPGERALARESDYDQAR